MRRSTVGAQTDLEAGRLPDLVALREQFGIAAADTAVLADFSDADFSRPELVAGSLKAGEDFQAMKRERPA